MRSNSELGNEGKLLDSLKSRFGNGDAKTDMEVCCKSLFVYIFYRHLASTPNMVKVLT